MHCRLSFVTRFTFVAAAGAAGAAAAATPSNASSANQFVADSRHVPVLIISLNTTRGRARFSRLHAELAPHFSHIELIPAVDNETARHHVANDYQWAHLLKRNTPSEVGCALSHLMAAASALRLCVLRRERYVLTYACTHACTVYAHMLTHTGTYVATDGFPIQF